MADDLLSKLERAEGADRECAFALFELLEATDDQRAKIADARRRVERGELVASDILRWRVFEESHSFRAFTSIDAARALIARVLPGWTWAASSDNGNGQAQFWLFDPLGQYAFEGLHAHTVELAACLALLRAVKASEQPP